MDNRISEIKARLKAATPGPGYEYSGPQELSDNASIYLAYLLSALESAEKVLERAIPWVPSHIEIEIRAALADAKEKRGRN